MTEKRIEKLKFIFFYCLDVVKVIAVIASIVAGVALTAPGMMTEIHRPW